MTKRNGQLPPAERLKGYRAAFINPNSALLGPKFRFARHGRCGMELSEVLPHTARVADDLCLVRSVQTEAVNHAPAQIMMNSGSQQFGRPSFGAWLNYGLGSTNDNLPAFVAMISGTGDQPLYDRLWGSGFLPSRYQGVKLRSVGDPVPFLSHPAGLSAETRRRMSESAGRAKRQATEGYQRASEKVSDLVERGRDTYDRARQSVSRGVEEVRRQGQDVASRASQFASAAAETFEDATARRP